MAAKQGEVGQGGYVVIFDLLEAAWKVPIAPAPFRCCSTRLDDFRQVIEKQRARTWRNW
jgi:hypothetical protein